MAVSRRLRYEVLRRDGHRCRYCGLTAEATALTVDHVVPVALGGGDEPSNLVTACKDCNAGKAASNPDAPLVASVADDALRWAAAMRTAAAIREGELVPRRWFVWEFDRAWSNWTYDDDEQIPRPDDWENSLASLWDAGIRSEFMLEAIRIAMGARTRSYDNGTFRYFCGVCWTELRARQEIARALIAKTEYE